MPSVARGAGVPMGVRAFGPSTFRFFFFQAEDGIRYIGVTGVQTCALPISATYSEQLEVSRARELLRVCRRVSAARLVPLVQRSEERRVGKECRSRWLPHR